MWLALLRNMHILAPPLSCTIGGEAVMGTRVLVPIMGRIASQCGKPVLVVRRLRRLLLLIINEPGIYGVN